MSIQNAKEFLVKIATDVKAAKEAQSAHEQALVRLGEGLGFRFSAADLRKAMADVDELDQLTDDQLAGVTGGASVPLKAKLPSGVGGTLRPGTHILLDSTF